MPGQRQERFVVLEGLDGVGTTTLSEMLTESLQARDLRVRRTAEPTDGPLGRLARAHVTREITLDAHTAALAFTADRTDHLENVIRPALARGRWVVCDRYLLSTLAYQAAEGVDPAVILAASDGFDVPGLTVVLEVPEDVRRARLSQREASDRYEGADLDQALRAAYERAIDLLREIGHRIEIIDATAPPDEVLRAVLARLDVPG